MWTDDEIKLFESSDLGDKSLKDEDGDFGWGWELIHCELKPETFTDVPDLIKKIKADAVSGDFTVEDIYNKYCVRGY